MAKTKNGSYVQNVSDATLLQLLWLLLRFLGIPDLAPSEAKGKHLADLSTKNVAYRETNSQTSFMVQRDVLTNDHLEKLNSDTQ